VIGATLDVSGMSSHSRVLPPKSYAHPGRMGWITFDRGATGAQPLFADSERATTTV